jgi:hypothetical protein
MTSRRKEPAKMMNATAGLHRDHGGWQLLDEFDQGLSPHRSTNNHCAAVIYPNNAAAVLPDVDTQKGNMHGSAPSLQEKDIILDVPGRAGQPITNRKIALFPIASPKVDLSLQNNHKA